MGAPAVVLTSRPHAAAAPLRVLQAWHLWSLDAPTVAFCWVLLFAELMHVPHALPAAAALGCAVWLVYAADRLLDARGEAMSAWFVAPQSALTRLYREHARQVLVAGVAVGVLTLWLLLALPRPLAEAWVLLAVPLALYAAIVHGLRLHGRWKAMCVAGFFAVAVALPPAVHGGAHAPLLLAALAFGGVCRANCAVLRGESRRVWIVLASTAVASLLPLGSAETRAVVPACLIAIALLAVLLRKRDAVTAQMGRLGWRALVDAALVAPALLVLAAVLLAR